MLRFELNEPFLLENGQQLDTLTIAYETFGNRNTAQRIVWVCHALTGNTNVESWWPGLFGSNRILDPQNDFILCANMVGSPYGSTSPLSINSKGRQYLKDFPLVTNKDNAKAFQLLRKYLAIDSIDVLIGSSLGGQQALEWLILEKNTFKKVVLIATNGRHSAYGIAFNTSQRMALESDITFDNKNPNGGQQGLSTARSIALLSYRSYEGYRKTQTDFEPRKFENFKAESYQRYQGEKLCNRFNAYSYYALTRTMDAHDISRGNKAGYETDFETEAAVLLKTIDTTVLVIGISSDLLFPLSEQQFLAKQLTNGTYAEIESDFGHDGFLIEFEQLNRVLKPFLNQTAPHHEHAPQTNYSKI
jgi:homoserine O-acetyltransferase/O-succinyltransferase